MKRSIQDSVVLQTKAAPDRPRLRSHCKHQNCEDIGEVTLNQLKKDKNTIVLVEEIEMFGFMINFILIQT